MANKKSYFQQLWLSDDKFLSWISRSKTRKCILQTVQTWNCVIKYGWRSFNKPCKWKKASDQTKVMDLEMARNFFKPKATSAEVKKQSKNLTNIQITSWSKNCEATQSSVTAIASSSKASIDACFQGSFVQKAEIMQVLKQVYSGLSDNSCKNVVSLFQSMLPDSQIAQKMRLEPN